MLYRLTYKQLNELEYFHLAEGHDEIRVDTLSAWGKAEVIRRKSDGVIEVDDGTYTACPPMQSTWRLRGHKFILDNQSGKGIAHDVTLYVHDVPVMYAPYLQFPLDKRRKTGFLFPTLGLTSTGGTEVAIPFYWNIAPNYDATITPHYMSCLLYTSPSPRDRG